MLGFRGHFSTKTRPYSTTLGALRAARADHQRAHHADQLPHGDTVLIVAHWRFVGLGHLDDNGPPITARTAPPTQQQRGEQP